MSVQQALAAAESAAVRHGGRYLILYKEEFGLEIAAIRLSGLGKAA